MLEWSSSAKSKSKSAVRGVAYISVYLRMRIHFSFKQPWLSELRYRFEWVHILKYHDIYPFLIIIEYSDCHADPNNYSQPMHNIIILVHNYIVVTLYILVW